MKAPSKPQEPPPRDWHTLEAGEVLRRLGSRAGGLATEEVRERLERYGPNALPHLPPPGLGLILLRQFQSPLIYVLAVAAAVSVALGEVTDAAFIALVLALNAAIGGLQEWRAERSSRALQQLLRSRATAVRDGVPLQIDGEQVVPGDVLLLESGDRVPADLRLVSAQALEVDESLLTGESVAVAKEADWTGASGVPLGDRRNLCFAGSVVARGRGRGVVVATGSASVVGQLAIDVGASTGGKPPLLVRMERFSRVIGIAVLVACAVVATAGVLIQGYGVADMFLLAVALAVAAIPEGLPVAMTVALSVASRRMARRGVIVRRLAAVEGLGSCTLIASDKTGTLTCNQLTVRRAVVTSGAAEPGSTGSFEVTGEGYAPLGEVLREGRPLDQGARERLLPLARAAALCNEATLVRQGEGWSWRGDPTDVALLAFARKAGVDPESLGQELPQVQQIPFEPERRYAATFHRAGDAALVLVKGAPERVLAMSAVGVAMSQAAALARELAEDGYRVLAFAQGLAAAEVAETKEPAEPVGLELLGLVGMIDPLRPGVREAVARCHDAGIGVVMVTGDHPVTALAIARELGLASQPDQVLSGIDLDQMDAAELRASLAHTRVFARTAPQQKLQLVLAARDAGHFVAVTGDGVNDAPALRVANIGVAMGRSGTDVAREAAALVISDDDFGTIVAGVEEGRVAYDNIRKVVYLVVSTGAAEVVLVSLSLFLGLPLPLTAVQLLWLNLVTNGIQDVALAFEPRETDVLLRAPRPPRERIFDRLMIERTLLAALVIGVVGLLTFRWMLEQGWSEAAARNGLLLLMVLFENVHIGNSRSETVSLFRLSPFHSPILLMGTLGALLIHVLAMYLPGLQVVLGTAPVEPRAWLALFGCALTVAAAMELHKLHWRRRHSIRAHH